MAERSRSRPSAPTVGDNMSTCPVTVGSGQPLSVALRLMQQHRIRHLPVLDTGELIGVVSDRDLRLVQTLRKVDPDKLRVEEAMTPDPYVVGPDAPLEVVARTMSQSKYGSAIVVDGQRVVGVFTVIDALRALKRVLEGLPPKRGRPTGQARPVSG